MGMFQLKPSQNPALREVLKNGLALLEGKPLDGVTTKQAACNLLEVFEGTDKISEALARSDILYAVRHREDFERHKLVSGFLGEVFPGLGVRFRNLVYTLTRMKSEKRVTKARKADAAEIVKALISAIQLERNFLPLSVL